MSDEFEAEEAFAAWLTVVLDDDDLRSAAITANENETPGHPALGLAKARQLHSERVDAVAARPLVLAAFRGE